MLLNYLIYLPIAVVTTRLPWMSHRVSKTKLSVTFQHTVSKQIHWVLWIERLIWLPWSLSAISSLASPPFPLRLTPFLGNVSERACLLSLEREPPLTSLSVRCLPIHYSYVAWPAKNTPPGGFTDAPNTGRHLNRLQSKLCAPFTRSLFHLLPNTTIWEDPFAL